MAALSATTVGAAELQADVVRKPDGFFRAILMDWEVRSLEKLTVTVREGFAADEHHEQFVSLQLYGFTVPSADDFHFCLMEQGEEHSMSLNVDGKVELAVPESWRSLGGALVALGLQVGPSPRLVNRALTNWSRDGVFVTEMPAADGTATQFFYFSDAWVASIANMEAQWTAAFLQAKEQAASELEEEDDLLGCFIGQQVPELPYGVAEVEQLRLFVGSGVNVTGARVQFWRRVKFGEGQLRYYFLVGEFHLETLFSGKMGQSSPVFVKTGDEIAWLVHNSSLEGHWEFSADGGGEEPAQCLFGMVQSCNENEFCAFKDMRVTKHTTSIVEVAPIYNLHSEGAFKAHRRQRDLSFLSMALEREASTAEDFYSHLVQHKLLVRWKSLTVFVKDLDPDDVELTAKYWHRVQHLLEVFVAVSVLRTADRDMFAKLRTAVEFLKLVSAAGPLVVMVAAGQAKLAEGYLALWAGNRHLLVLEASGPGVRDCDATADADPSVAVNCLGQAFGPKAPLLATGPTSDLKAAARAASRLRKTWPASYVQADSAAKASEQVMEHTSWLLAAGPGKWCVMVLDADLFTFLDAGSQIPKMYAGLIATRSVRDVIKMATIHSFVDELKDVVDDTTTYAELIRHREERLTAASEAVLDKVELRTNFIRSVEGVLTTPVIYASKSSPDILAHIRGRDSYVVKVSHMARSENVFVVNEGKLLYGDLSDAEGDSLEEQIQYKVGRAWQVTGPQGAVCGPRSSVALAPGVVVEEIVVEHFEQWPEPWILEVRVHMVWGTAILVEWVYGRTGSLVFCRNPQETWQPGFLWSLDTLNQDPNELFPPTRKSWMYECSNRAIALAEKIGEDFDHIRLDFLTSNACQDLYLSETALCPAIIFNVTSQETLGHHWRWGYGVGDAPLS